MQGLEPSCQAVEGRIAAVVGDGRISACIEKHLDGLVVPGIGREMQSGFPIISCGVEVEGITATIQQQLHAVNSTPI